MNDFKIQYREYKKKDFRFILEMALTTWDYNEWVPVKAVKPMGTYYISEVLGISDAVWVAEYAGNIVGIAAVKNKQNNTNHFYYKIKKWLATLEIMVVGEGKNEFYQFIKTEELSEKLLTSTGKKFDAELTILMVDSNFKGFGVGSGLYNLFLTYLEQNKLNKFYIFTDSSCNFEFYDNKGLKCIARETFYWEEEKNSNEQFLEEYFLYSNIN